MRGCVVVWEGMKKRGCGETLEMASASHRHPCTNEALVCLPEHARLGGPPERAREGRACEWQVLFVHPAIIVKLVIGCHSLDL